TGQMMSEYAYVHKQAHHPLQSEENSCMPLLHMPRPLKQTKQAILSKKGGSNVSMKNSLSFSIKKCRQDYPF
ncbi:hypothetical protein, partial [Roseibium sp. RKSG952]|uniref:hypothetical protein n=1 Tax=Roseibium sp. RKSG952 TaxID=2529384 RepID=UPI001AD8AF98